MDRALLGRYEYRAPEENSSKFWHVYYDQATGKYITEWGRIGSPAQGRKAGLSEGEAYAKIQDKRRKGYRLVGGFKELRGETLTDVGDGDDEAVVTVKVTVSRSKPTAGRKVTF